MLPNPPQGRGAASNPANRFERLHVVPEESFVDNAGGTVSTHADRAVATEYFVDASRSVITRNDSPDVPFEASLNPYRGCEHGCAYCYARPTHEYLGLSAGLDFETRIFVKQDAPELLRAELARRTWMPTELVLSGVTDPYQPIERRLRLTRRCLEVLADCRNPVIVITKNALVWRDVDLLRDLATRHAACVALSITTLDADLARRLEPRASAPDLRFEALARLNEAGIPAGVMVAPVVPGLTEHELPRLLARAGEAGARFAGYVLLRLPGAVAPLFDAWLAHHRPDRRDRVLARVRDVRAGRLNDPRFGSRMRGSGPVADLVADVFRLARDRAGIPAAFPSLSTDAFRRPGAPLPLFDTPSVHPAEPPRYEPAETTPAGQPTPVPPSPQ